LRTVLSGLRAWLVQRVSAVYMLVFLVFFLVRALLDPPRSYRAWHDLVLSPAIGIAASIFFAALLVHVWVGVRDVALDYVRPVAVRVFALVALGLGLLGLGVWVIRILWLRQA
jgi:succinate dehydrogenase / fumarate reductase membrane anchor subunit